MTKQTYSLKLILLFFLVSQAGCDVTLKRKYNTDAQMSRMNEKTKSTVVTNKKDNDAITIKGFSESEKKIIRTYYNDRANIRILHYAIKRSPISKKQDENLQVSRYIPSDVQIVPLPIELDNMLRQISISMLRVQVGKNIILMKVSSRKILDIVKL